MYEWCKKDICLFENDNAIEAMNYLKRICKVHSTTGLNECHRCMKNDGGDFSVDCQARMKTVFELIDGFSELTKDHQRSKVNRTIRQKIGLAYVSKFTESLLRIGKKKLFK